MFRSATFKLTLWYLAIVMAISLVFSIVLYDVATAELSRGLHRETQRIFTQFPVFQDNPLLRAGSDYASGAHRIFWRLVGFNVIVLFVAGWTSYWLAKRTLEPIEQAHEQQKRFTADVSHELRTPLTALRMESEVGLMGKSTAAELKTILRSNLEEVSKLEALINNLLRLTKLEAETLQQQFTTVKNTDLVAAAIDQVKTLAEARQVKITSDSTDVELQGDREALVQLLVILLDNAIKYSPKHSTVTVTSAMNGDNVSFSVIDKGSGIARRDLEHVFDRFYRADSSRTKSEANGHGLGLSIAKMIADVHHGSITLHSRPKHGTTATVLVPLSAV